MKNNGDDKNNLTTEQNFWILIPSRVLDDKRLNDKSKLLYGVVLGLSANTGSCFAGNKYLAARIGSCSRHVTRLINSLCDAGYINRHVNRNKDGTVRVRILEPQLSHNGEPMTLMSDTHDTDSRTPMTQTAERVVNNNNKNNIYRTFFSGVGKRENGNSRHSKDTNYKKAVLW